MNTQAYKFDIWFAQTYITLPTTLIFKMAQFCWTSGKNQSQCGELTTFGILPPQSEWQVEILTSILQKLFPSPTPPSFKMEFKSHWNLYEI